MTKRAAALAAIVYLMFIAGAEGQKQPHSTSTALRVQSQKLVAPHLGTIAGNTYFNERFSFTFSFPQAMLLEPPVPKPLPMSGDELAHFAPDKIALLEQSNRETSMVFHAADPVSGLPRIAVFAEETGSQSGIKTTAQYISREMEILRGRRAGAKVVGNHGKVLLNGQSFERLDLQFASGENVLYHEVRLYGMVKDCWFQLGFFDASQAEAEYLMNDVLSSFHWNAAPITAANPATLNGGAYIKNQVYHNEFLGLTMPLLPGGQVSRTDTLKKMAELRGNRHATRMGHDEIEFIMSRDEKDLRVLQLFVAKLGPKDLATSEGKEAHAAAERMAEGRKISKPTKVKVAGLSMYVLDVEEQRGAKTGYMRMYLLRHKGHGLMFQALADSAVKMREVAAHFENTASFTSASAAR